MTAEQIILQMSDMWYGQPIGHSSAEFAEAVAQRLRDAGIDLDHTYQQQGWFDEGRWYDESTYMWTVDACDADDGLTPLFGRRPLDGVA